MGDSVIMCDEVIEADAESKSNNDAKSSNKETKTIPRNFNEKNVICKIQNFYILHFFISIFYLVFNELSLRY